MHEDELIFLGAATLLAAMVEKRIEPADQRQIEVAVTNAHNLFFEVAKCRKAIIANQSYGLLDLHKRGKI